MSFPACRHAKPRGLRRVAAPIVWLGSEPYRLFFLSGILFSIAGVLLWPLFYRGQLGYYPGVSHARVMIECFGGAFVVGFLGTAGPRMLGAARLRPGELATFFSLHVAGGTLHLLGSNRWGDACFAALLGGFAVALAVRVWRRGDLPPPPLALAVVGILSGLAGVLMWLNPAWITSMERYRLAGLLLNQGFLLAPVMGVGMFLFPRLLGDPFGEPAAGAATRRSWRHTLGAALALLASFALEAYGQLGAGLALRVGAFGFALAHVRWLPRRGAPPAGTLANALRLWCLPLALAGLAAPWFAYDRHIALNHLLYIGGFGLVCLIAASRVLFGHSGAVERFARRAWPARIVVFAVVLAALTRASADFLPRIMTSHYEYAAIAWAAGASLWALWHARRFFQKEA